MGGDHKCSVCHATFTRPQHVARHMRSHTGDRPYKCQHCGDQFARSDLLARHVNKCHANEKSSPTTNGNRRKGSASASRATTSKQACDQCVQSSLPCDGCNPCSKCVQRKSRCTYIKFHRQTAPTGPGHNPRPTSSHPRLAAQPHASDFILGPPPMSVPSMSPPDPYTFNFPHIYPSSDPQFAVLPDAPDFAAKYRAQAEFLRRGGDTIVSANDPLPVGVAPGLYADGQANNSWFGWAHDGSQDANLSAGQNKLNMHDAALNTRYFLGDSRPPLSGLPGVDGPNADMHGGSIANYGGLRRESVDFSSDSSSTSQSIPSSATSSNIHLPLDTSSRQQQMAYHVGMGGHQHFQQLIPSEQDISLSRNNSVQGSQMHYPMHHDIRHSASHPNFQTHEGGFSSAFGLMSIDDPNMIAGLATDGAPFFSSAAMNMAPEDPNITPMPNKQQRDRDSVSASLPTPGLSRELRDFWKEYMQTPPTGPGGSATDAAAQSSLIPNQRPPTSPNGSRRVRVASLPSVNTPTSEAAKYVNGGGGGGGHTNAHHHANGSSPGTSSMRKTLHGTPDDLRSYEAAVLARKTPTLNLVPRKGRGSMSGSSTSPPSLAYALDKQSMPRSRVSRTSQPGASFANSLSRESSVSEEALSDRPSFKRLPSQTLGPANAKRAQLSNEADDLTASNTNSNMVNIRKSRNGLHSGISNHSRTTSLVPSIAAYAGGAGERGEGN